MIYIVAKQTIDPAKIEQYRALAQELVEASRKEEGNISYVNVQSTEDPRVHTFIECWKDEEAIKIHNATEHFTRIIPQLGELFAGEEEVKLYQTY